jgi:peptide/nickel transport system permease protein
VSAARRHWGRGWLKISNLLGLGLILLYIAIALAAPTLAPPLDPADPAPTRVVGRSVDRAPHPPSAVAPLGTLPGQIDIYYSLVWGTRSALTFGLTVALATAAFGVLLGALSGYLGGWINALVMRVTDAFLAFPVIAGIVFFQQILALAQKGAASLTLVNGRLPQEGGLAPLTNLLGSLNPVMIAFIVFSWMPYARLTNSQVLTLKHLEFVQAARALGAGPGRIVLRHLIPNAISPAVVLAARDVGGMVLLQATFTFIGMGGSSVWGELLVVGRNFIMGPGGNPLAYWWVTLPPTLTLVLFGVAWNLLGDGLNEWLNPRNR